MTWKDEVKQTYSNMNWLAQSSVIGDDYTHLIDPNKPDTDALCGADISERVYLDKNQVLTCPACEKILRFCRNVPKYYVKRNGG